MRDIKRNPFEFKVVFDNRDSYLIQKLAKKRQEIKDKNLSMVRDKRIIKRDNTKTHEIGLLGEYGLQKITGYNLDEESYLSNKKDDFKIHNISIEVKTLQGYLTFKKLSDFKSQIAVLAIYDQNDYSYVFLQGWITKKEFRENHFIDNFGYGDRPCLQPITLHPIHTLTTYCLNLSLQLKFFKELKKLKNE